MFKNIEAIISFIKHQTYNLFHIIFTNFPIVPMATIPIFRSFVWQLYDIVVRV